MNSSATMYFNFWSGPKLGKQTLLLTHLTKMLKSLDAAEPDDP